MHTAAEFDRRTDRLHAHLIAVFLAEKHHRPRFASLVDGHDARLGSSIAEDLVIDEALDAANLVGTQRRIVRKVEPCLLRVHQRPLLLHVRAKHFAQGLVHQVRRRVVAHRACARDDIDAGGERVADGDRAGSDDPLMTEDSGLYFLRILNGENTLRALQHAAVADLTTRLGVKRRLVEDDDAQFAFLELIDRATVPV
jgi:hypothetical protein